MIGGASLDEKLIIKEGREEIFYDTLGRLHLHFECIHPSRTIMKNAFCHYSFWALVTSTPTKHHTALQIMLFVRFRDLHLQKEQDAL
jgi:hypothetical protein